MSGEEDYIEKLRKQRQKLVDICYDLVLTFNNNPAYFKGKTNPEIAEWVSEQLCKTGFPVKPRGSSYGVLAFPVKSTPRDDWGYPID